MSYVNDIESVKIFDDPEEQKKFEDTINDWIAEEVDYLVSSLCSHVDNGCEYYIDEIKEYIEGDINGESLGNAVCQFIMD